MKDTKLTKQDIWYCLYDMNIWQHLNFFRFTLRFRFLSRKDHAIQIIPNVICKKNEM